MYGQGYGARIGVVYQERSGEAVGAGEEPQGRAPSEDRKRGCRGETAQLGTFVLVVCAVYYIAGGAGGGGGNHLLLPPELSPAAWSAEHTATSCEPPSDCWMCIKMISFSVSRKGKPRWFSRG